MIFTALGRLRLIAFAEGTSFLLILFITMPLRYLADIRQPNIYVGFTHGILFVLYVLLLIQVTIERGWTLKDFAIGLIASVIPFGTFYADKILFIKK